MTVDPNTLSAKQRKAVLALAIAGELGAVDLADAIGVAKTGVATLTRSLHERGLVRCNRNTKLRGANMWRWTLSNVGREVAKKLAEAA